MSVVDYSEPMINLSHLQKRIRENILRQRHDHASMLIDEAMFEMKKLKDWVVHDKAKRKS